NLLAEPLGYSPYFNQAPASSSVAPRPVHTHDISPAIQPQNTANPQIQNHYQDEKFAHVGSPVRTRLVRERIRQPSRGAGASPGPRPVLQPGPHDSALAGRSKPPQCFLNKRTSS